MDCGHPFKRRDTRELCLCFSFFRRGKINFDLEMKNHNNAI